MGANTPKAAMESAATENRRPRLLRLSPEMLCDMAELKSAQSSDPARLAFLSTCAGRPWRLARCPMTCPMAGALS